MKKQNATVDSPSVFFIIGLPRSGTTLLQQILDHHSLVGVCPESNFMENILRYKAQTNFQSAWHYQQFMQGISNWLVKFNDPAYDLIQAQLEAEPAYAGSSKKLLQQLIREYLDQKQKKIFGEKTPENSYFFKALQAFCPSAKYVVLLRHPFDIICSLSRSLAKAYGHENPYTDKNLLNSAVFVKRGLRSVFSQQNKYKTNTHVLFYEDLVRQPEKTLTPLCTFLDICFEKSMLNFTTNNFFIANDQRATDLHKGLSQSINSNRIDQYRRLLSADQITLLYHYLSTEFELLSYAQPFPIVSLSWQQRLRLVWHQLLFRLKHYLWKAYWIQLKINIKSWLRS